MGLNLTKEQRREAERIAWGLRLKFWSQERIAAHLTVVLRRPVSQSSVSRMIERINQRALDRLTSLAAHHKALQVERLDHLADEAMQAWEASKRPEKSAMRVTKNGETIDQTSVRERDGNPAFLKTALDALADQRKILGLDAPPADAGAVGDLATLILEAEAVEVARADRLSGRALPPPQQGPEPAREGEP